MIVQDVGSNTVHVYRLQARRRGIPEPFCPVVVSIDVAKGGIPADLLRERADSLGLEFNTVQLVAETTATETLESYLEMIS